MDAHSRTLRPGRAAWWAVAGALIAVGAVGAGLTLGAARALLLVAIVAGLVTLGCWQLRSGPEQPHPSGPDLTCGLLSGVTALAITGLVAMFGPSGFWLAVLVAAVGWWVLRRPGRTPTPPRTPTSHRQRPDSGHLVPPHGPAIEELPMAPQPTVGTLSRLSTPQLCWTWRVSYVRIQRSSYPGELDALAELRGGCLEELQRRDPAAFARWFPTARAASDPARFFSPSRTEVPRRPHTPPTRRPNPHRTPTDVPAPLPASDALRTHRDEP